MYIRKHRRDLTRRDVVKTAAAAGAAAGIGPFFHATPARAAKTLKILQWSHFVPGYDRWFNNTYTKEWGKKNDTEVIVDNINLALLESRAAAEVSAQKGHDLVQFLFPPSALEKSVLPLNDIVQEVTKKLGKMTDVALRSTYNPKTKRYFGFPDNYVPDPIQYRKSMWFNAGVAPNTWENVRKAAPILKKAGHPVGLGMSNELDSNMFLMSLLYCYGSSLQDANGNPAINNKGTIAALNLMKDINRKFGTTFVFSTHDKRVMARADRLIRIEDGEVTALGVRADGHWSFTRTARSVQAREEVQ